MKKIILLLILLLLASCDNTPVDMILPEDVATSSIPTKEIGTEKPSNSLYVFIDESVKKATEMHLEKSAEDFTAEDLETLSKLEFLVIDEIVTSFEDIAILFPQIKYLSATIDNLSPKQYDLIKNIHSLKALTMICQSITVSDYKNNLEYFEISYSSYDDLPIINRIHKFSKDKENLIDDHIEGDIQNLVRIKDGTNEYELISTNKYVEGEYPPIQERKIFVYDSNTQMCGSILDASYGVGDAFKNRLQIADVNFDGNTDILVDNGHFGNQGYVTYTCFINNEGQFIKCDSFSDILNPAINAEDKKILGTWRNWAASHSYAMYTYENDKFIMSDCLTEEILISTADSDNEEWQYIVESLVDGEFQEVEILYTKDFSEDEIYDMFYVETSFWGISSNKWNNLYNSGKMFDFSIYDSDGINDTIHNIIIGASEPENQEQNQYFFPASIREKEYLFESLTSHDFIGKATLKINKLENTKINGYYELFFTDFNGICDRDNKYLDNFPCIAEQEKFSLGYFFVDSENIYRMQNTKSFLDIFAEVEEFPPSDTYVQNWNGMLRESGENRGYFGYRLIFKESGLEDTFGTPASKDERYHELISVSENERQYHLFPITSGTQEHMHIHWEKDKGITYYANWAGALKDYIAFYDEEYKNKSMLIP